MLKDLITRILNRVAGEYIVGLTKENLTQFGLFSGEVKIQNVSLNPNAIDMLNLPISHQFSRIEKFELKAPMKSIGSKPVELLLDGLYLVVTPKEKKEWTFQDYNSLRLKLLNIESFAAECISKIAAKQQEQNKSGEKDAGYIQKLTMKIIDNLQVTIKNIHVRFEDTITKRYSWGFCLDKIETFTINKEGEQTFIDRTIQANKNEPTRKLLMISNAGIYWNAHEERFIYDEPNHRRVKIMNGMIMKEDQQKTEEPVDFLLKISFQVSLIMNNKGNFEEPEIKVNLNLDSIDLHLQQKQLQQIIEQLEYAFEYANEIAIRKKNNKNIDEREIERLSNIFSSHYNKIMKQDKDNQTISCLNEAEKTEYEDAVIKLDIEILQERAKKIIFEIQKAIKIKELEDKKKGQKQGFMSYIFKAPKDLITEEEKNSIKQLIDENFSEDAIDAPKVIRPKEYVYCIVDFTLQGACIKLSNDIGSTVQSLLFQLHQIKGNFKLREENNEIKLTLKSMQLKMIDEFLSKHSSKTLNILNPTIEESSLPLIEVNFISKPLEAAHIDKVIDIKIRSVRFNYDPHLVLRLTQFFDIQFKDEQFKQSAQESISDQIQKEQMSIQDRLKNGAVLKFNLDLDSPVIVIPLKQGGYLTKDAWVLNLGNLKVNTIEDVLKPNLPFKIKALDMFNIQLSKTKLTYFISLDEYNNYIQSRKSEQIIDNSLNNQIFYNTIDDFSINLSATFVKQPAQGKIEKANILIEGGIDKINLRMNPNIYKKLLSIGDCFEIPFDELKLNRQQTLEQVENKKNVLLNRSIKTGIIYKRGKTIKTWVRYNGVLSGGYIYLFQNPNDLQAKEAIWVKNSILTRVDENFVGFKNAFSVKNKYTDIYLACEKENASKSWIENIEKLRTLVPKNQITESDLEQFGDGQQSKSTELEKQQNLDQILIETHFQIGNIQLSLFDDSKYSQKPFLALRTQKLILDYFERKQKTSVGLILGGLFLSDYLYSYKDSNLNDFITSSLDSDEAKIENDLIQVGVVILDKGHPEYKSVDLDIDLKFNNLTLNYKPDTLAKILIFFQKNSEIQFSGEEKISGNISDFMNSSKVSTLSSNVSKERLSIQSQQSPKLKQQDSIQSSTQELQDCQTILLQANVQINQIKIVLINHKNRLPINDLLVNKINLQAQLRSDEIIIKSSLGNLQARDLTNYPNTIYLEEDWQKIKPQEILGISNKNNESNLLEVDFRMLFEGSSKIESDNVDMFVNLIFNSIHLNYIQAPVLRFIDYILEQFLDCLENPFQFIHESEIVENHKISFFKDLDNSKDPIFALDKIGAKKIAEFLEKPILFKLDIIIYNPLITLKPNPQCEYLQADLGVIKVTNKVVKDNSRIMDCSKKNDIKETYSDIYQVNAQNMLLRVIKGNQITEITQKFNLNVSVNLANYFYHYKYLYGNDIKIDTTIKIYNHISPIIFRISNDDYNLIMKCIMHNIAYDDGCDRFLVNDWERNQKPQTVLEKMIKKEEENKLKRSLISSYSILDRDGVFVQVDLENLSVFALDKENKLPFVKLTVEKMRVIQIIDENIEKNLSDKTLKTNVYAQTLNASCFSQVYDKYIESSLLGDEFVQNTYSLEEIQDINILMNNQNVSDSPSQIEQIYEFVNYDDIQTAQTNKKFQIVFELELLPNDDKLMQIYITNCTVQAKAGHLLAIVDFFDLDSSVESPEPVYKVELTKEQIEEKQKAEQKIQEYNKEQRQGVQMKLNVKVQNILVCTPCPDGQNVIAIRSELDFNLKLQEVGTKQIQELQQNKNNAQKMIETSLISAFLRKLEIFICNEEELKKKDFKKVMKRNILLPLDLNYKQTEFLIPQQNNTFQTKTIIDTSLQKAVLKITFQDYTLVNQTIVIILEDVKNQPEKKRKTSEVPQIQKQQESADDADISLMKKSTLQSKITEEQKIQRELEHYETMLIQIAQNEVQVNQTDIFADIQGLEIIIINDLNSSYVPVIDFNLYETNVKFKQNNISTKVAANFELGAEYYNSKASLWEPIIERVGFSIDFVKSDVSNTKQLIVIEMNPNYNTLNLTVSTQFLYLLQRITYTIEKEIIPAVRKTRESYIQNTNFWSILYQEEQKEESDEENIQEISPYAVRNETGYPIEVVTDLSNIQYSQNSPKAIEQKIFKCQLNNFEQKNFKVDMIESKIANDKKETFVFKKTSEQVKVKVLVPGQQLRYIQQIDLDKVRSSLRTCKNEYNKKLFDVITEVKLDNFTLKKVLNISSPYQFFNGCNRDLQLTIYDQKRIKMKDFNIRRNQKFPIPIDLLDGSISVNIENSIYKSSIYNLNDLKNNLHGKAQEIQVHDLFLILKVSQDIQNKKCITFTLEPPYKIKNCLPKPVVFQFINYNSQETQVAKSKRLTDSSKNILCGQVHEFYNCSQIKESFMKLTIPNHFPSNEAKIKNDQIDKVILKDANGNQSEVSVHMKQQTSEGCKYLYLYCKGYLINECPQKLNIYTSIKNKKECKLVGGQNYLYEEDSLNTNFILFGNETGEKLSISDINHDIVSKSVNIGGVGTTQIDLQTQNDFLIPIYQTVGVNVTLKSVDFDQNLFSKVITISPRFILVNKTGSSILIKQKGQDDKITPIEKDTRIPLFWYDDNQNRFLSIKLLDSMKEWNWSGNLNVQELGTVNFLIRNGLNRDDVQFLRTDVRSDDSNIYIVIEKVPEKERPYLIQNLSSNVVINVFDLNVILGSQSETDYSVSTKQQYYFSWDHPFDKEKRIYIQIIPNQRNYQIHNMNFSPDQIYLQNKIQLAPVGLDKQNFESIYIKWSIDIDGFTRIITFEDSYKDEPVTEKEKEELRLKIEKEIELKHVPQSQYQDRKLSQKEMQLKQQEDSKPSQSKNKIEQQLNVFIKQIGISIVQNHRIHEKPKELIYATIKGVEFITVEKQESRVNQLRVKLLNIDQNSSYNISNPVILTPNKYALYNKENTNNFFINIMVEQNLTAKNITLFKNLVFEIDPFAIRIEEQFIKVILDFINTIEEVKFIPENSHLNSIKNQIDQSESMKKSSNKNKKFKWQECEIPPSSIPTFINQLILSNIEANFVLKGNFKTSMQDYNIFRPIFSAMGVVLADIEAPIKLKGIKLTNCFETFSGIFSKLTDHYKSQVITEILKACGSLNIIGNPVGLFQNITTGVSDLINKPAEGFVKGPLEGGLGIMEGASSLVRNTMAGAFNSVNKMTGSISSGVSALCMDEEYLQERERMRQIKPQNVLHGTMQGINSIFSGVTKGITGVFLNPVEGAKKSGAFGLLKGVGLGFAGLIAKPVSGVLDAASSVAGGIKNTIISNDEKANELRMRIPRVFYGRDGFYKEFIQIDAAMKEKLQTTSKGKFANADFLQAFLIKGDEEDEKNNVVLVMSYEVILAFEESNRQKKWYFETNGFSRVELKQNGIQLTCSNQIQKLKSISAFLTIRDKEQKEYIFQQISTLKFLLEEEKKINLLDN